MHSVKRAAAMAAGSSCDVLRIKKNQTHFNRIPKQNGQRKGAKHVYFSTTFTMVMCGFKLL